MIKNIVLLICAVLLIACNNEKNGYIVKGVMPDGSTNGKFVHMLDYNDGLAIDSVKVNNGKFTFKGVVKEPKAVLISINRLYANIIIEKGVITVDMSNPESAKGTPLIEEYNKFTSEAEALMEEASGKLKSIDMSLPETELLELRESLVEDFLGKIDALTVSYLKNHPNDVLGAMVFYTWVHYQGEPSAEKFIELSKLVGENVMSFGPIMQIAAYFNTSNVAAIGSPFIDFTIKNGNMDGSPVSLSDYVGKGKYVLVAFWASWCMPCRMEASVISEVYDKYKGDKFNAVSVAVWDKREATISAIKSNGFTWPQILDAQTIPTDLYGVKGVPHILLFGPDGTIVARDLRGNNLRNKVAEVMKN